ncbi:MAG: hypothetical protein ACMUIL_00715 [bacterium]
MLSALVIGLAVIALIPAIGILSLFVYYIYGLLKERTFENRGHIVLTRRRIGDILKGGDLSESLQVFRSALCDHSEVNGVRYYTKFAFGSKITTAHDNHRKAFIAHTIGVMLTAQVIQNRDLECCSDILLTLARSCNEKHYTQLIVWNSLSRLMRFKKNALMEMVGQDTLRLLISKDFMSGIGVVKFIFDIKQVKGLDTKTVSLINDTICYTLGNCSTPLVALLIFKLIKSPYFKHSEKSNFMKIIPNDLKLKSFLEHMNNLSRGFTKEELSEGLTNLGLQSPPYSHKTTEGEIVEILTKYFIEELYVPASYMLHSFNANDVRAYETNFLWV